MVNTDQAGEIVLFLFFSVYFIVTLLVGFSIPGEARYFPLIINGVGAILILSVVAIGWQKNESLIEYKYSDLLSVQEIDLPRQVIVILALTVCYSVLVNYIGLLVATILFLSVYGYLYIDDRNHIILLLLIVSISIYTLADMLNEQQRFLRGALLYIELGDVPEVFTGEL